MAALMKAKVFEKDENRFLVPGCWYDASDPDADPSSVIFNAMMFAVALDAKVGTDWLDIDASKEFPNLPSFIAGRQFEHGGMDIILIGGPMFDAANAPPVSP